MTQLDITWASLWRILFFIVLGAALYIAKDILIIVFLAIIFSAGLDAPVSALEKRKIPRIVSTIIIFLVALTAIGLILYALIPVAIEELKAFLDHLTSLKLPVFGPIDPGVFAQNLSKNLQSFTGAIVSGGASVFDFLVSAFGNAILVVATVVLIFYMTIDRSGVEKFLSAILPIAVEEKGISIYHRVRLRFGLWLQGQLVLMVAVGSLVFLGLWILGVPYAFVIALLAGILEIVPVVGPIFAGAVAFLVGLTSSLTMGLYAAGLFAVIQQLENHLLVPIIMRRTVGVNPVVVVIALLLGAEIAGFLGILIAVPVVVVLEEILGDWGAEKTRHKSYRLEI